MSASAEREITSRNGIIDRFEAIGIVTGVVLFAFLLGELLSYLPTIQSQHATGTTANLLLASSIALSFVGMFAGGLVYLLATSRGWEYIDLNWPTRTTAKYATVGLVGSLVIMVGLNIGIAVFDIPIAESWVTETIGTDMQMLGLFLLVVFFFNAPAEEFLFRNVVQKRLAESFSIEGAILLTGSLFAVVHLPGYLLLATVLESVAPIFAIFLSSLVYGAIYAYTEDLLTVIVAHALYNAFQLLAYATSFAA